MRTFKSPLIRAVLCALVFLVICPPGRALAQASGELITGLITDRATGAPIANARIFFYGSGYGTAYSDASGRYTFTEANLNSFGGALTGNLYAGVHGYFEAPPVSVSVTGETLPVVKDISLLEGGPIVEGMIRDADTGAGVAGATVAFDRNPMSTFLGGATTASVSTQADGSYTIDSSFFNESALSTQFSVNMRANASGYLGRSRLLAFETYPQSADFELVSASGPLITGVVTDRATGAPIEGAGVFFYGSAYGTVYTDADGRYTFTGSELSSFGGDVSGRVYIGAEGYFEAPTIEISSLSEQEELPAVADASLQHGGALIGGVVRDRDTGDGIAGARLTFDRSPMSGFRGGATTVSVVTESDGSYEVDSSFFNEAGLTTGFTVSFRVNAEGYLGRTRLVSLSAPQVENFDLAPASGPYMTGIVTDRSTGDPIAGARVFFYGSAYGTVFTDQDGRYTFSGSDLSVFGGDISGRLYVGKTGYFEATPIEVTSLSGQPSLPVVKDVSLPPGGVVVQGSVRNVYNGAGISAASISFDRNPMSAFLGGGTTVGIISMTDGTYKIDSSYFNESALTNGFWAGLRVNAGGYLGQNRNVSGTDYPVTADFDLVPLAPPSDVDGDGVQDVDDPCPADPLNQCNVSGSGAAVVNPTEGGTIETGDGGLHLDIDPGDITEITTISVTQTVPQDPSVDLTVGANAGLGQAVAVYDLEPDGLQFSSPVELTITADVTALNPKQRGKLHVYLKTDTDGDGIEDTFIEVTGNSCVVTEDPPGRFMAVCTASVSHFSTYALLAPLDGDDDGIPDQFDGLTDVCPVDPNVVEGFGSPMTVLVPEDAAAVPLPEKAFKAGRTIPLKLRFLCGETLLAEGPKPEIVRVVRTDDAADLPLQDLDSGQANDSGALFRFEADEWVFNLGTGNLGQGTFVITVRMPDGTLFNGGFVLR